MLQIVAAGSEEEIGKVRELFQEYADSLPVDLEYQAFSSELRDLPGGYRPPDGALFLARAGGAEAGCVALRRIDGRVCEMKRLYVRPAHRGARIGPQLMEQAIEAARALGYEELWLDTLPSMADAQRMYAGRGFRENVVDAVHHCTEPRNRRMSGMAASKCSFRKKWLEPG